MSFSPCARAATAIMLDADVTPMRSIVSISDGNVAWARRHGDDSGSDASRKTRCANRSVSSRLRPSRRARDGYVTGSRGRRAAPVGVARRAALITFSEKTRSQRPRRFGPTRVPSVVHAQWLSVRAESNGRRLKGCFSGCHSLPARSNRSKSARTRSMRVGIGSDALVANRRWGSSRFGHRVVEPREQA